MTTDTRVAFLEPSDAILAAHAQIQQRIDVPQEQAIGVFDPVDFIRGDAPPLVDAVQRR